jgi:branched-chain amino acid transport system substrate-binding protein
MKKTLPLILGLLVVGAIVGFILIRNLTVSNSAESVRVAANLPLTGPVAAWSGDYPKGFQLGLDDACKSYGVARDVFKTDFQDNAGKPAQAASVAQMQLASGFDVYISGSSESSMAVVSEIDPLKVPHFIAAFDPFLASENPSRLRIMANSKIEAPLFIAYARAKAAKTVHIIHVNSKYANEEFDRIVQPALEQDGITVTSEAYEFATSDYKPIALKAKSIDADLIFVAGYSFQLRPLINDLRSNGLLADHGRVMGVMDVVDFLYDGTPLEELNNLVFACPLFDIPGAVPKAPEFRKEFENAYGKNPSYVPAYAYDNAWTIVKAFHESGNVSVESIRKALPFIGVTGKISLDEDGDIVATVAIASINSNGEVERLDISLPEPDLNTSREPAGAR